jgi:hypothetical protein
MLLLSGALMLVVTGVAYAYPRLRLIEDELPDVIPDSTEDQAEGTQQEMAGDRKPTASPA